MNMGYMVATVIYRVPKTVNTTRAIYKMDHALHVNLDGLEQIVIKNAPKVCTVTVVDSTVQDIVETVLPVAT